jgi:hypothetical protein
MGDGGNAGTGRKMGGQKKGKGVGAFTLWMLGMQRLSGVSLIRC